MIKLHVFAFLMVVVGTFFTGYFVAKGQEYNKKLDADIVKE